MNKPGKIIYHFITYSLLIVLLIVNYVLVESGLKRPPVQGYDGQEAIGIVVHLYSIFIGIITSTILIIIVSIRIRKRQKAGKMDIAMIVICALLLWLDLLIYFIF